jgi:GntR family transcriptional regulator, galactonate operon transcriptional repressor
MDRRAFLLSTQEARRLIEPGIAELAARKHTPEQLDRLIAALQAMKEAKSRPETVASDVEFHDALLACANNMLLMPFGLIIEALSNLFEFTTQRNPHFAKALKLHESIVRAVAASDGKAAHAAMQTLLNDTDGVIDTSAPPRKRS